MAMTSPLHDFLAAKGARFEELGDGLQAADFGNPAEEYRAARESAVLIDLSHRTKLELTGGDRVRFLHNLCTNDITALSAGQGCEAFITSIQAKVIGHVFVFAAPDSLVLDTVPGQAERLMSHLDRYLIREDVQLHDRTGEWAELLVTGPRALELLQSPRLGISIGSSGEAGSERLQPLEHCAATVAGVDCFIRRVDWTGERGYLLLCQPGDAVRLAEALDAAGAALAGRDAFETLRIEAGFPLYGVDITEDNLPQEIGRDRLAISFTKGCYLGQETVARIDSYGHVNRYLVGLRVQGAWPTEPGALATGSVSPGIADAEVVREGKVIGRITSATISPELGSIALAYVRRGTEEPGTQVQVRIQSATLPAEVTRLPFRKQ